MGQGKSFHLTLGARDWEHPAWVAQFYPQDMPASWRLCFYANEFSAVLVPAQRWQGTEVSDWRGWLGEVREGFRFYLELADPGGVDVEHLGRLRETLGPQLAGLVVPEATRVPMEGGGGTAAMGPWPDGLPCYSASAPATHARLWTGPDTQAPCGPVGRVVLPSGAHPRVLRDHLEAFARCSQGRSGVLFLDAPPAVMGQTVTLAGLLGFT